eukprot:g2557.t1
MRPLVAFTLVLAASSSTLAAADPLHVKEVTATNADDILFGSRPHVLLCTETDPDGTMGAFMRKAEKSKTKAQKDLQFAALNCDDFPWTAGAKPKQSKKEKLTSPVLLLAANGRLPQLIKRTAFQGDRKKDGERQPSASKLIKTALQKAAPKMMIVGNLQFRPQMFDELCLRRKACALVVSDGALKGTHYEAVRAAVRNHPSVQFVVLDTTKFSLRGLKLKAPGGGDGDDDSTSSSTKGSSPQIVLFRDTTLSVAGGGQEGKAGEERDEEKEANKVEVEVDAATGDAKSSKDTDIAAAAQFNRIQEAFETYDADNSGGLSLEEFHKAGASLLSRDYTDVDVDEVRRNAAEGQDQDQGKDKEGSNAGSAEGLRALKHTGKFNIKSIDAFLVGAGDGKPLKKRPSLGKAKIWKKAPKDSGGDGSGGGRKASKKFDREADNNKKNKKKPKVRVTKEPKSKRKTTKKKDEGSDSGEEEEPARTTKKETKKEKSNKKKRRQQEEEEQQNEEEVIDLDDDGGDDNGNGDGGSSTDADKKQDSDDTEKKRDSETEKAEEEVEEEKKEKSNKKKDKDKEEEQQEQEKPKKKKEKAKKEKAKKEAPKVSKEERRKERARLREEAEKAAERAQYDEVIDLDD